MTHFINNESSIISGKDNSTKLYKLCFATMCKNEEKCILETLNSIYKYIDYWVICDTGSIDNTTSIINDFFKEKNIPGELFIDKWVNFGYNKTLLFERCYKKSDFFIHFDADDLLVGDINHDFNVQKFIGYKINIKRYSCCYKDTLIFNNHFKWKVCGVAHNTFNCLNNYNNLPHCDLTDSEFYILSRDLGDRSNDNEKYLKDAIILREQFFNTLLIDKDNLNNRSIFYTAQSFYDCKQYEDAVKWYCIYTKFKNTWDEELFESYCRIVYCMIELDYPMHNIIHYAQKGIELFSDRSEIYFTMCNYFMKYNNYELSYFNIIKASECDFNTVHQKYDLFINKYNYNPHLDYLIVFLSFKTYRMDDGLNVLKNITDIDEKNKLEKIYNELKSEALEH